MTPDAVVPDDPVIDFEKLDAPPAKSVVSDEDLFHFPGIEEALDKNLFHPTYLTSTAYKNQPEEKKEKFSVKRFFSDKNKPKNKTPEQLAKEQEERRLKLAYQVRLYLYTFRNDEHLFSALNLQPDDKTINKYIQDLYIKKRAKI